MGLVFGLMMHVIVLWMYSLESNSLHCVGAFVYARKKATPDGDDESNM